jgi:hypothetical protein
MNRYIIEDIRKVFIAVEIPYTIFVPSRLRNIKQPENVGYCECCGEYYYWNNMEECEGCLVRRCHGCMKFLSCKNSKKLLKYLRLYNKFNEKNIYMDNIMLYNEDTMMTQCNECWNDDYTYIE